ncbi:TetR/AcrR family transcriptional regulator [Leptospira sp. 96542]|nr:TetR/AcrR family transcriptional regulator [Leptospira sp. 96542]
MKTKKGEKEKLRRVILDKAISYFKKRGHGGTGTDQIMTYMGLTRGALYSHFKSKDDLFANAVCHDLKRLEESLVHQFTHEGSLALQKIIEDHLSEKSLKDIEGGCAFTSLSSDMQRSKTSHRGLYEAYMNRIYALFAKALHEQFPEDSEDLCHIKALNLYSGLVGTLTMARTMKDTAKAREILEAGREFLKKSFLR